MAITDPAKVPQAKISSIDITSFNGGLDQRGEANITNNSFSIGRNIMLNEQGLATYRYGLKKWLPDTVETVYEIFPALYNGELFFITADDGKIKYIKTGELSWTDAGGDNTVTTGDGIKNTFLRVLDKVLILNGTDKLGYLDLSNMEVVHYNKVDDPSEAPTATPNGLTNTGDHKIYYAVSFNSTVGETAISPILSYTVNKIRETWKADGTEYLTIDRKNTPPPAGAVSWNLYMATAAAGGTIAAEDMLPLALGLDLSQPKFVDNGSLPINLSAGTAPSQNSTEGPKAKYGLEVQGRPFLFGITGDEYALFIGGNGDKALDFSPTHGGYRLLLNEGTNYFPMSVVGFRNGQGIPSLTVLFSNTQGLSKQSIIEQQTIEYGDITFVVWGATEQNYGAAGVSSPYGVVNYRGGLYFPSSDGFAKFDTQASVQNVLSNTRISDPVLREVDTIKNNRLNDIVGTAWGNKVLWTIPARGFNYNNEILVHDLSNKDLPVWYTFDIRSQWLGVVSPNTEPAFIYVCQDNHIFRLEKMYVAQDETSDGVAEPFPVELVTGLVGANSAHNGFYAVVQTMFYLLGFLGTAELVVKYRDRSGVMRTKSKTVTNGSYTKTASGNWSSPGYLFNQHLNTPVETWGDVDKITDAEVSGKSSMRVAVPINAVTNEMQASVIMNPDNSALTVRTISFQGQNLGVSPDLK